MADLYASYEHLLDGSRAIVHQRSELDSQIASLRAKVSALLDNWEGEGREDFAAASALIDDALVKTSQALDIVARKVYSASAAYQETDEARANSTLVAGKEFR